MTENRLLAEYLGFESNYAHGIIRNPGTNLFYRTDFSTASNYPYWSPDKDWNQLMMVVEKIEEDDPTADVEIHGKCCSTRALGGEYFQRNEVIGETKIEAVYNACVEYIKLKS